LVERSDPPSLPLLVLGCRIIQLGAIPQNNVSAPAESLSRPAKVGYLLAFIGTPVVQTH
jgi:hypothetical protein